MSVPRGTAFLVVLLTIYLACELGREVFRKEVPPAFFVEERSQIWVGLGKGFPVPGLHQFSDGATPGSVIGMTGLALTGQVIENPDAGIPLQSGEALDIVLHEGQVSEIKRNWIPASQSMALGVALHPDRMSCDDWQALPGAGRQLAKRIELDRQLNGDFGSLEQVQRVKGIGPGRIKAWKEFFLK